VGAPTEAFSDARKEVGGDLSEQQLSADDTIETEEPSFVDGTPSFERLAASLDAASQDSKSGREHASGTTLPGLQKPSPAPPSRRSDSGHTQPFDRKLLAGHATVVEAIPSVIVAEAERTQPSSIAPFAIDVEVERIAREAAGEPEREARHTVRIRRSTLELRQIKARWIVGAVALVAGGIVAFAFTRPSPSRAASDAVSTTTVTAADVAAPPAEVPEQPHAEPSLVPVTGVIVLKKTSGTLIVDGEKKRIEDGHVVVTCGKHRLGAGRRAQSVLVPCGGTLSR
jgi:hypothetical protein